MSAYAAAAITAAMQASRTSGAFMLAGGLEHNGNIAWRFVPQEFEMTDKIVVFSTCATEEEAGRIARLLVEERLAACVNVVPGLRSYYRWKDAVESGGEFLLVIKSARNLFGALSAVLENAHSYEVPEAIALAVVDGSANYLGWLDENLRGGGPG